ncbi:hypothetical protein Hanom_Chr04g00312371 [Helianthus anomalus]
MPAPTDNPTNEEATAAQVETNRRIFLSAAIFIRRLHALWNNHLLQGVLNVDMPTSSFAFVINALLTFTEIKSQRDPQFPFQTHPQVVMLSVTSLLVYGFASVAQHFISATRLCPDSVYAIIARLGQMACLCILVGSLASWFYF